VASATRHRQVHCGDDIARQGNGSGGGQDHARTVQHGKYAAAEDPTRRGREAKGQKQAQKGERTIRYGGNRKEELTKLTSTQPKARNSTPRGPSPVGVWLVTASHRHTDPSILPPLLSHHHSFLCLLPLGSTTAVGTGKVRYRESLPTQEGDYGWPTRQTCRGVASEVRG